jgi:hypothetical protein
VLFGAANGGQGRRGVTAAESVVERALNIILMEMCGVSDISDGATKLKRRRLQRLPDFRS